MAHTYCMNIIGIPYRYRGHMVQIVEVVQPLHNPWGGGTGRNRPPPFAVGTIPGANGVLPLALTTYPVGPFLGITSDVTPYGISGLNNFR